MDDVFKALADPSRRMLLDSLNAHNGQTLRQLCAGLDMARQSVSKHLAVLEAGPTGRSRPGKGTGSWAGYRAPVALSHWTLYRSDTGSRHDPDPALSGNRPRDR